MGRKLEGGLGRLEADDKGLNMNSDNTLQQTCDLSKREDFLRFGEGEEEKMKISDLTERMMWDWQ